MEDRRFKIEDVGGDDDVDDYRACEDWLAVATTINLQPQGGGHPPAPKLKQFCKTGEKVIGQHRGKTGGWVVGVKEEMGAVIRHRHSKREVSGFDPRTLRRGSNGEHRGPHWGQHRVTIPICNCNMACCSLSGILYCHTVFIEIGFSGSGYRGNLGLVKQGHGATHRVGTS